MSKKENEEVIKRTMRELSETIKAGRKEKGLSIEELSEKCGVSPEELFLLESGDADGDIHINKIKKVMDVLGYELKVSPIKKFWQN